MREAFFLLCIVALLGVTQPATAQLRTEAQTEQAPVKLYGSGETGFTLNSLFSPEHFQMNHSFEMASGGGFGGGGYSYGMYTNSLRWQFNQKLAARVDVSYLQDFGGSLTGSSSGIGGSNGQLFLRNAEVAYRPSDNVQLHFQVRQSPYGSYMGPYGYSRYQRSPFGAALGASPHGSLFWRDR